jgi:hypothetical protein
MSEEIGVTTEEIDDLAWALIDAFPEVDVNPVHAPGFWEAKATQLLPVINKIRDRARQEGAQMLANAAVDATWGERDDLKEALQEVYEGREITLDEALEKTIIHEEGCGWETGPYCTCGADPGRMEKADDPGS